MIYPTILGMRHSSQKLVMGIVLFWKSIWYNGDVVKYKVGYIEALVSLRHLETGKTAWQEKSDDFLDHPEIQRLRAVKRIHIS
jgi:hypothetical protein